MGRRIGAGFVRRLIKRPMSPPGQQALILPPTLQLLILLFLCPSASLAQSPTTGVARRAGQSDGAQAKVVDLLPPSLATRMFEVFKQSQFARLGRGTPESACQLFETLVPLVADLQPVLQEYADRHSAEEVEAFAKRLKRRLPLLRTDTGHDYRRGVTVSIDSLTFAQQVAWGSNSDLMRALDRFEHGPLADLGRPAFVQPGDCSAAYWCDSLETAVSTLQALLAAKEAQPCLTELVRARVAPALAELAATRCVCERRAEAERSQPALSALLDSGWPGLSAKLGRSLSVKETRYYCNRCGIAPRSE